MHTAQYNPVAPIVYADEVLILATRVDYQYRLTLDFKLEHELISELPRRNAVTTVYAQLGT